MSMRWVGWLIPGLWLGLAAPLGAGDPDRGWYYSGKSIYRSFCASCHGMGGRGDGPVAVEMGLRLTDIGDSEYLRSHGDDEILRRLTKFGGQDPTGFHSQIWNRTLKDQAARDVVAYLRSFIGPTGRGNPVAGEDMYLRLCAVCHGKEGFGDGPEALLLTPPPRNLRDPNFRAQQGSFTLFDSISRGGPQGHTVPIMKAYADELTIQNIWDLVEFIQLQPPRRQGE
ncbi:MAG TPA: cytochrome c [Acidobacteriota bacterium]